MTVASYERCNQREEGLAEQHVMNCLFRKVCNVADIEEEEEEAQGDYEDFHIKCSGEMTLFVVVP